METLDIFKDSRREDALEDNWNTLRKKWIWTFEFKSTVYKSFLYLN